MDIGLGDRAQRRVHPRRVAAARQHGQVARDVGALGPDRLDDIGHAALAVLEGVHDRQPDRLGDRFHDAGDDASAGDAKLKDPFR